MLQVKDEDVDYDEDEEEILRPSSATMPWDIRSSEEQRGESYKQEEAKKLRENLMKRINPEKTGDLSVYNIPLERRFRNETNTYQKFKFTQEAEIPEAGISEAGIPEAGIPEAGIPEAVMPEAAMPEAAMPVKINEKVILVIGETGSGKTTLINVMMNYMLGVEWEDGFRFKLIDEEVNKSQAHSQTPMVTAYEILQEQGLKVPYPLTIIDTPGFGDTRGIERDKQITGQLKECLSSFECIDHLNAVCFVLKGSSARLTPTQKYIFNSIYSIFGKDIANNILFMLTFVDENCPPALESIKEAELPCLKDIKGDPIHYLCNNGSLFATTSGFRVATMKENWQIGTSSMTSFFDTLGTLPARSLVLTNEVLLERAQLEATLQALVPEIRASLKTLEALRLTKEALKDNINEKDDFTYEVPVTIRKKQSLDSRSAMNCRKCKITCHYPCNVWGNPLNYFCEVFTLGGKCKICKITDDQDCNTADHRRKGYKWVTEQSVEEKRYKDTKAEYEHFYGEIMTNVIIIEKLETEQAVMNQRTLSLTERASSSVKRLQEIALKPNSMTTPEYIEEMIRSEEMAVRPGYNERVVFLKDLKEQAVVLKKIQNNEELLPEEAVKYQNIRAGLNKVMGRAQQIYSYVRNKYAYLFTHT